MERRRRFPGWPAVTAGALIMVAAASVSAADKAPLLTAETARAERILIAVPQHPDKSLDGIVDVPPGGQFIVEITRAIRGAGRKSAPVKIVNGGDAQQHPKYVNGRTYVFLLKKNPDGSGWINLGTSEIPVHDGKVQFLNNGKIEEQITLKEFEELAVQAEEPVADKTPRRDSLTGRWAVALSNHGANLYFWLLELSSAPDGATSVKLMASSKSVQAALLKSAEITDHEVHLVIDADGTTFDFQGRFADGVVRGSIMAGPEVVFPAWLEPTDITDMRRYDHPQKDAATDEFVEAAGQQQPAAPLTRFVRRHAASPLALTAFQDLLVLAAAEKPERAKFEKLADEYLEACRRWGPRIELQGYATLGILLSRREVLPELALDYLNAAEARFGDDASPDSRRAVGIERGKRLIVAGEAQQGVELLNQIRAAAPFDPGILFALARQAEKDKRTADAMGLYAELSTLPQLEQSLLDSLKSSGRKLPADQQPRRVVLRLWTEQHGNTDGLDEWLDGIYEARLRALAPEQRPARGPEGGTRVALCELFTGARCTSCVAADAAVTALGHSYSKSELIVLRYHVHVPGPDPLANDETRDRLKIYGGTTPPLIFLNGRPYPGGGGDLAAAATVCRRLRGAVESSLADHTDLKLELSATAENGKVAISAKALGLKSFPPNTRLQVVLAEDKVRYQAPSGTRFHEMVVRNMPTGSAGVAPVQGSLSFSTEIDLLKLKRRLLRELAPVEAESEGFDEKPLALAALHLVAFLQNAETGEVLQAAAIAVTGDLAPPASPRPGDAKAATKKPAAGGN